MTRNRAVRCLVIVVICGIGFDAIAVHRMTWWDLAADLARNNVYILDSDFDRDGLPESFRVEYPAVRNDQKSLLIISKGKELLRLPYEDRAKEPFRNTRIGIRPAQDGPHLLVVPEKTTYGFREGYLISVAPSKQDSETLKALEAQINSPLYLYGFTRILWMGLLWVALIYVAWGIWRPNKSLKPTPPSGGAA